MANTSGQISLQLSSFCASLKTKNKTDPENHIWKNYHRWQCLFVYSLDNAHSIIYLHFIFTQKLPRGHFHSNSRSFLQQRERWWQEDLSSVKMWLAMWNGSVPADPLERQICRADGFARRPWRLISYNLWPLRRPMKNGLPCSSGLRAHVRRGGLLPCQEEVGSISLPAYSSLALQMAYASQAAVHLHCHMQTQQKVFTSIRTNVSCSKNPWDCFSQICAPQNFEQCHCSDCSARFLPYVSITSHSRHTNPKIPTQELKNFLFLQKTQRWNVDVFKSDIRI